VALENGVRFPLTPRSAPHDLWAQREYARCYSLGIAFASHGEWWHYRMPGGEFIYSVKVPEFSDPRDPIVTKVPEHGDWLQASRVIAWNADHK
jgi:hypothetical protein